MDLQAAVLEPGRALAAQTVAYLPSLLAALLIVAFGWLLAKFARLLVFRFLLIIRFDMASERAGIDDVLVKADIRQSPAELVAIMAQWAVGLAVLLTAASVLGLTPVSELLNHVVLYVPKVIAAVVALILGLFVANVLAGSVRAAAANAGLAETDVLAALPGVRAVATTVGVSHGELGRAAEPGGGALVPVEGWVSLGLARGCGA